MSRPHVKRHSYIRVPLYTRTYIFNSYRLQARLVAASALALCTATHCH